MPDRPCLSRRSLIKATANSAAAWHLQRAARAFGFATAKSTVCKTTPEQTVGPYYIPSELLRSDIREGKPGLPLSLRVLVMNARTCQPLPHAAIDVWHCDASGVYAGFSAGPEGMGPGGPPPPGANGIPPGPPPGFGPRDAGDGPGPPQSMGPPPASKPINDRTFLRGIQFTGDTGQVTFATIFPGFYMGRTNHIHFKVREGGRVVQRNGSSTQKTYMEGHTSHIGQIFFPEDLTAKLMRAQPYAGHTIHRMTQAEDDIFCSQHGSESIARLVPADPAKPEAGYLAELIVAVDPSKTPAEAEMGPPRWD